MASAALALAIGFFATFLGAISNVAGATKRAGEASRGRLLRTPAGAAPELGARDADLARPLDSPRDTSDTQCWKDSVPPVRKSEAAGPRPARARRPQGGGKET